jgi:hypothetical protein
MITVYPGRLQCPKCGNFEEHPTDKDKILIRGFKVDGYSQCLVCAGYYNPQTLEVNPIVGKNQFGQPMPEGFDERKGWFR